VDAASLCAASVVDVTAVLSVLFADKVAVLYYFLHLTVLLYFNQQIQTEIYLLTDRQTQIETGREGGD